MKIVIDARYLRTSSGRYLEGLLGYLQNVDQANTYTVLLKPKDVKTWQPKNKNFQPLVCPYQQFTLGEQTGLLKQIKSLNADLVHFGMVQQPVFYKGKTVTTMMDLTTTRFKNPAKNPVVFAIKQTVYKWVNKRVAKKSDHIITISEFSKQDIAAYTHISPDKITVTYPAADAITDPAAVYKDVESKQFVMYVGRPQPHKNLKRLVDAFGILQASNPDLHLVLAGKLDDNYRQLQTYAADKGIEQVIFTDFVSEGQLRWLYENAAAYIFPSLSEGFGLPGLEAMVHGCPVVSSSATCLPEVYGDAAAYFDPTDVQQMADKISAVINNEALRKDLIQKGKTQVAKYSWHRMAEQTLEIYNNILLGK